jgi:hypothetical protein
VNRLPAVGQPEGAGAPAIATSDNEEDQPRRTRALSAGAGARAISADGPRDASASWSWQGARAPPLAVAGQARCRWRPARRSAPSDGAPQPRKRRANERRPAAIARRGARARTAMAREELAAYHEHSCHPRRRAASGTAREPAGANDSVLPTGA